MPTFRHLADFRGLAHKTGNDYVAVSADVYQGADWVGLRLWRRTGNEDELMGLSQGLNLPVETFAYAFLSIVQVLGGEQ
jgi:hypothetical protein